MALALALSVRTGASGMLPLLRAAATAAAAAATPPAAAAAPAPSRQQRQRRVGMGTATHLTSVTGRVTCYRAPGGPAPPRPRNDGGGPAVNISADPRSAAPPSGAGVWATRPLADRSKLGGRNLKTKMVAVSGSDPAPTATSADEDGAWAGVDGQHHHTLATLPPLPSFFEMWDKPASEGFTLRTLPVRHWAN